MNLRSSAFAIGCIALILQLIAIIAFTIYYTEPQANKLEKSNVEKNLHRGMEIVQRELYHLEQLTQALASQTIIQQMVQDPPLVQTNPTEALQEQMLNDEINLMYILSNDRKVLWENIFDLMNEQAYPKQPVLTSLWNNYPAFLDHASLMSLEAGIYGSSLGPMWLVSTPIASTKKAQTVQGILIVGKLLTPEVVQMIQSMTYTDLQIWPLGGAKLNSNQQELIRKLSQGDSDFTIEQRGKFYRGYMALSDLSDKPNFLLSIILPRSFFTLINDNLAVTCAIILIFDVLLIIGLILLMNHLLLNPLARLTRQIEKTEKFFTKAKYKTPQELTLLVHAIQSLQTRQQARFSRETTQAFRDGISQAEQDLFIRLEENFHLLIEGISNLEKKLFNLPTSEIEWIIAESKTRKISPAKLVEYADKLNSINEQIRQYQKESRRTLTDLYSKALRNAAVLRAHSRNIASSKALPMRTMSEDNS